MSQALARPQASVLGEDSYPTIHDKAGALLESLVQNHAFANANKRTAIVLVRVFLQLNGIRLQPSKQEFEDFPVYIADEKPPMEEIVTWLTINSKPI